MILVSWSCEELRFMCWLANRRLLVLELMDSCQHSLCWSLLQVPFISFVTGIFEEVFLLVRTDVYHMIASFTAGEGLFGWYISVFDERTVLKHLVLFADPFVYDSFCTSELSGIFTAVE